MKKLQSLLFFFALVALIAGCAPLQQPPLKPLDAGSVNSANGKYVPKVANFQVILDTSLSMNENGKNDFLVARDIVSRINQGIPADLSYNAGLRSIGHIRYQSGNQTDLLYGMTDYDRSAFHDGLNKIKYTGGSPTPMAAGLAAAANDLQSKSGNSALIIVSDGLHMDDAPAAAKNVKEMLGDDFCIYTVAVGSEMHGAGQRLLQKVAEAGQCGFATTDTVLSDSAKLAVFIESVFLAPPKAKKMAPRDSDGDGVTDDKDLCPGTPRGDLVDENGCTLKLTLHVNFDHDKAEIKPDFKAELESAAAYIQTNSNVPYILIAGHTDHDGTVEYNQKLSEDRANAVRDYLIKNHGIDPERLFIKGFGKLQPVADNATKQGRYLNRRVEIICCALKPF